MVIRLKKKSVRYDLDAIKKIYYINLVLEKQLVNYQN